MEVRDDLRYTDDHEWLRLEGEAGVVGVTAYAAAQLGDIVFVELPAVGATLSARQAFAIVESVKAVSDLLAPVAGEVLEINLLGLYMIDALSNRGELDKAKLMDSYVTFLASMLRSVRFGASDAHGKANMIRFNFFAERGAFVRDADGRYRVDFEKMRAAMNALSEKLLTVQGDGDYAEAKRMTDTMGVIKPELAADLAKLKEAKIPIDVRFEQGLETLGLAQYAAPAPARPAAQ